jgi:mono/diheme cytochrome c family protein
MSILVPKHLSFVFLIVSALLFTVGITMCSEPPQQGDLTENKISYAVREGKRLFVHYCSPCHGEDAQGAGRYFPSQIRYRPTDFVNTSYLKNTEEAVIFKAIKFGSVSLGKSNYSPAYKNSLRDEEMDNIIEYLRSLKKKAKEEPFDSN